MHDFEPASAAPPACRPILTSQWGRSPGPKATGFTLNLGVLLLLVCGIALMYGSVGEWVHVSGSGSM